MKQLLIFVHLTIILLFSAAPAQAESLSIVTVNQPPYGYIENGKPHGLSYEMANAIATAAGYTPRNTIAPLAQAMQDIENGQADIVILFPSPAIETAAEALGVVLPVNTVILGRADSVYRKALDIRGKRVATVRGTKCDEWGSKNKLTLIPAHDYSQGLKMLLSKQVDGIVGPQLGIDYAIKSNKFPTQAFGTPLELSVVPATLYLSKVTTSEEKRNRLTKAVKHLLSTDAIDALLQKYSL